MARKATLGAHGSGTIRHRADGRWEARYTIGTDPISGKQIQKSIYGKTQKEVRQKLAKITAELDEGTYLAPVKDSVEEWLCAWLDLYARKSVSSYTYDSYKRICDCHIRPYLGKVNLGELNALQIQQFYNHLSDEKGLSPKTVKNIHGVLHKVLQQAVKIGMLRLNPTEACELPECIRREISPMEQDDLKRFLESIQGHSYEFVYRVTVFTGLREGEVLGLTWDCIDFEKNEILVNKQLKKTSKVGGEYILAPTKNRQKRRIMVAPSVMRVLKEQKERQEELRLAANGLWSNEWELVFTNEFGGHLCHFTVYKHFKAVAKKIGMPNARFHDLRHSYAVAAIESGDDIKTVQDNLGHATASFTLDVYGHVSQMMRQQSAERMEQFIQSVNS